MKNLLTLFLTILLSLTGSVFAQDLYNVNGVKDERNIVYALINARIITEPGKQIDKGILLIQDGKIKDIGNVSIPPGAVVIDLVGRTICPSFIDPFSNYGMPDVNAKRDNGTPQFYSNTRGAYSWNQAIKPETNAVSIFSKDQRKAEELRKLGFGVVNTLPFDGISRGTSTVVLLGDKIDNKNIIKEKASATYSFSKGSSTQDYPSSLMGSIALLRQTYLDANWYASSKQEEKNLSLQAWNETQNLPQIFDAGDKLSGLRANEIAKEFGVKYIIKGGGDEYERINEIKASNNTYIIPLNFPAAYDVEDAYDALQINLGDMKHWEMAPANPSALENAGIRFMLTIDGLKEKHEFIKNIRKAIEHGWTEDAALRALTTTPAEMLNIADVCGKIKNGMIANFLIFSGKPFDKETKLLENWVQGNRYKIAEHEMSDIRGSYDLNLEHAGNFKLNIAGEKDQLQVSVLRDTTKLKTTFNRSNDLISLQIISGKEENKKIIRISGHLVPQSSPQKMEGRGQDNDGNWFNWTATYSGLFVKEEKKDSSDNKKPIVGELYHPNMAYGWTAQPGQDPVLFKNATVWTNEDAGILINTDVYINKGKIVRVGKNIDSSSIKESNLKIVDATNKHISAGIIDEHSHIAISRGVNEGTQAVTSEVRISDVVNSDDINIYRQLAGGVTTSQLLHGSANPIGGQSAIIKLRWGMTPEEMKMKEAPGFIKFALGENVKQSNWGDRNSIRFPQTRMGVEQVYIDAFYRAKEYKESLQKYNALSSKLKSTTVAPRRDLELDALVEILEGKRFISCHSYVQSEINMLLKVADSMGFKVNTFTHILEGYKVADKMKAHGAGASTFSDWWAYKYEVIEAIPYNAAILHEMGVLTAINSDDAEMGRRLNQEAAKAVKYGSVSEEEALKMVTLNPAKLLHIDKYVGSIKEGKDADLVLWSDNPLSVYAHSLQTYVDGRKFWDAEADKELQKKVNAEKARLIYKMMDAKSRGESTRKPEKKDHLLYHCDSEEGFTNN